MAWMALHRNWCGGWADYTCRIQNEISNHLQNLYKNSRFMAFRHSPHIYLYTVAAALSLVSLSRSFLWQWRRHQHPPSRLSEPASQPTTLATTTTSHFSFLFPRSTFAFCILLIPTPSFAVWEALEESDAGGWWSIVSKSRDEKFYPLAEDDDETIAFNSVPGYNNAKRQRNYGAYFVCGWLSVCRFEEMPILINPDLLFISPRMCGDVMW